MKSIMEIVILPETMGKLMKGGKDREEAIALIKDKVEESIYADIIILEKYKQRSNFNTDNVNKEVTT